MKILSETAQEGRVVELTANEWHEFKILARALEDKRPDDFGWDFGMKDRGIVNSFIDFNGVFGAIRAFYMAKFRQTELKQLVGDFEKFMEIKKD
jgi:hypothetical protein